MQIEVRLLNSIFTNKTCSQNPFFHLFHKSIDNYLHNKQGLSQRIKDKNDTFENLLNFNKGFDLLYELSEK